MPVQDFKNCSEHCKELEGGYFEKFYVANICSS
jgi:hypothetical protein